MTASRQEEFPEAIPTGWFLVGPDGTRHEVFAVAVEYGTAVVVRQGEPPESIPTAIHGCVVGQPDESPFLYANLMINATEDPFANLPPPAGDDKRRH